MRKLTSSLILLSVLIPSAAFALEGIGPRVSVTGTVEEVRITDKQKFDQVGGEFIVRATNGQRVTIVLGEQYEIISEGRLSRRSLLPSDVQVGMQVRIRGWRVNSNTLTASLFILTNIELNPQLTTSGTLQAIGISDITVLLNNGESKTFEVNNDTQVQINYTLSGRSALDLVGKQALLTLNPNNNTQVRILRITGEVQATRGVKPSTVELKRR